MGPPAPAGLGARNKLNPKVRPARLAVVEQRWPHAAHRSALAASPAPRDGAFGGLAKGNRGRPDGITGTLGDGGVLMNLLWHGQPRKAGRSGWNYLMEIIIGRSWDGGGGGK